LQGERAGFGDPEKIVESAFDNLNSSVELPADRLRDVRKHIWATITSGDSKSDVAGYKSLVDVISHPAAVVRLRAIRGTRPVQLLLNALILWRRLCLGLYVGLIVLGFWHILSLLVIPLILLVNLTIVNPLQTRINVELSARLALFDELMDEDDSFRRQVLGE
jgi:hypothetical protein